jgi:hypothetical protein
MLCSFYLCLFAGNSNSVSEQSQQVQATSRKASMPWQQQLPTALGHSRSSINSRAESIAQIMMATGKQHPDMLGLERMHAKAQQLLGHATQAEAALTSADHSHTSQKTSPNKLVAASTISSRLLKLTNPSSHHLALRDHTNSLESTTTTTHAVGSSQPANGEDGSFHPGHTSIDGYLRNPPQPGHHNGPSEEPSSHKHAHDAVRHQGHPHHHDTSSDAFKVDSFKLKHKLHNMKALHPAHTNINGYLARVQFEQAVNPSHTDIDGYLAKVSDQPSRQDLARLTR